MTTRLLVSGGVGVHMIPALQNIAFSPELAAAVLTAMTVLSLPGRLGYGWLADRFDKRYLFAISMFQQALGLIALAFATDFTLVIVFLLLYSPGYGGEQPIQQAIFADYFGRQYFASILGLSQSITMWGAIFGPLLAGYSFDLSKSYQLAFIAFALSNVAGMILIMFVRKPGRQLASQNRTT